MLARLLVSLYRLWHGRLRLPGSGFLLRKCSKFVRGLQSYPLQVEGLGTIAVDFRDHSGMTWLQHLIGDDLAAYDVESGLCRALTRIVRDGEVFWDIGANAGIVSAYVATAFPNCRVLAFEPNPRVFSSLTALFAQASRVRVYPFALSDGNGTVTLTIPKGKSVGASIEGMGYVLRTSGLTERDVDQVSVRACTGDSLVLMESCAPPPDVIKVDVEGHEPSVLAGLRCVIQMYQPAIFFEHLYLQDEDVMKLVPQGYSLHSVDNATGQLSLGFDRSVGHNSVLLPGTR